MRTTRAAALAGAVLLTLTACGGGGDDGAGGTEETSGAGATTEATPSPDAGTEPSASPSGTDDDDGDDVVDVANTSLGEVLVDAEGMTLYMFDPDAQGASTCYDDCAAAWPPLLTDDDDPDTGDGADDSKIGTVARDDGTTQVTYNGWPVYLWAQDTAPGDVTGQAVGGKWWVLDRDGEPLRTTS